MATAFGKHDLWLIVLNDTVILDQTLVVDDLIATDGILILFYAGKLTSNTCSILSLASRADHHPLLIAEHLL